GRGLRALVLCRLARTPGRGRPPPRRRDRPFRSGAGERMTRLVAKLKTSRTAYKLEVKGKLALPYAGRQLPKGEALRNGDLATGEDGQVYEIVAEPEKLLHIECPAPREAAIVGYVLGNGHVPAQIGKGFVRIVHVP